MVQYINDVLNDNNGHSHRKNTFDVLFYGIDCAIDHIIYPTSAIIDFDMHQPIMFVEDMIRNLFSELSEKYHFISYGVGALI